MGDNIVFWTNVDERHEFNINEAIKKAKEDTEKKNQIKEFIEDATEKLESINTFFESTVYMIKLGIIEFTTKERRSDEETTSRNVQHYETLIKENKKALNSFKNLLSQI